MSLNIQECQRNAIVHMLTLQENAASSSSSHITGGGSLLWKALVFDRVCQNLLAPLMKVGSLRQHGVTLNLLLESERSPVAGVPAVYLVEPTEDNIKRIVTDISNGLYRKYFLNFSTSISNELLGQLAAGVSQANCAHLVGSVADRFVHFVALSPTEFSFDLKSAFRLLHGIGNDAQIEALLTRIVDGLLSVMVSLGTVPVIRCPGREDSPATIVGRRLHSRLKQMLSLRGAAAQLFGSGASATSTQERLCLVLVDRELDMAVMARHSWSYQSLVHDLFGIRLNRVSIQPNAEEATNPSTSKPKVLDLDSSDALWCQYGCKGFPEAAVAISTAFQEFSIKKSELDGKVPIDEVEAGLKSTIDTLNAVPEMIMKKKSIDVHTNIATAVVSEVSSRDLDRFYEVESGFESSSVTAGLAQLEKMLSLKEKGTVMDKTRAALCFYLAKHSSLTSQQVNKLKELVLSCGGSAAAIDFIRHRESFKSLQTAQAGPLLSAASLPTSAVSSNTWIIDRSKDLLQGVRNLLPLQTDLQICQTVLDVLDLKATAVQQRFLYFDPKAVVNLGISDESAPRIKTPFRQSVVFCVGGGSYLESHALKDLAVKHSKQILYGSTDFANPAEFMEDLDVLGSTTR